MNVAACNETPHSRADLFTSLDPFIPIDPRRRIVGMSSKEATKLRKLSIFFSGRRERKKYEPFSRCFLFFVSSSKEQQQEKKSMRENLRKGIPFLGGGGGWVMGTHKRSARSPKSTQNRFEFFSSVEKRTMGKKEKKSGGGPRLFFLSLRR